MHCVSTGILEFHMTSAEMEIHFVSCAEKVAYQERLAKLFAMWQRVTAVPTVSEMVSSGVDEH